MISLFTHQGRSVNRICKLRNKLRLESEFSVFILAYPQNEAGAQQAYGMYCDSDFDDDRGNPFIPQAVQDLCKEHGC